MQVRRNTKKKAMLGFALFMALALAAGAAFGLPRTRAADAAISKDAKWISVKEIYNDTTQSFDHDNLAALFEALTGDSSFNVVQYAAKMVTTSADFRTVNGGNNIEVQFGGFKWYAVYLTTSETGDVILDLWRSNDGLNGYNGLREKNQATFSDGWGNEVHDSESTDKYPANMYSTSKIRVETLNAGGNIATSKNEARLHDQDQANQYARFTMVGDSEGLVNGKQSLTEYIATPAQVSYQEDEWNEETAQRLLNTKYYYQNEAYGKPREGGSWGLEKNDYSLQDSLREENEKYGAWQNDYLWLPSYSETGDDNHGDGIWEADQYLRDAVSNNSWLRSGQSDATHIVYGLNGGTDDLTVTQTEWVRPALHLNLTKAVATTFFEYAIKYDANDGEGEIPTEYHLAGERVTLPTSGVKRTGHTFLGWCKWKNSFSVIKSLAGEKSAGIITSLTLTREQAEALPDGTQTLYALWAPDDNANGIADYREYKAVYDLNDGSGDPPPEEYHMPNETFFLPTADGFGRSGCIFLGWSEEKKDIIERLEDASGIITAFSLTEDALNDLPKGVDTFRIKTFYAVWAEDKNGNGIADYLEMGTTIPELSVVVFGDMVVEYDGEPHKLQISGDLPAGFSVTYEGDNGYDGESGTTEPGIYTVTAIFTDGSDAEVARKTATLTITKKKYDMASVTFEDKTFPYDGTQHSLEVQGLPDGVSVTYSGSNYVEVGEYPVTATFTVDTAHYEVPDSMTATLTITKAVYNMAGVTFEDKTFPYDGTQHSLEVQGLPDGVSVTYSGNNYVEVGEYPVTATFTVDTAHYEVPDSMTATLTITKAVYDMAGVTFESKTFKYDGAPHDILIGGTLPAGVHVTYSGNGRAEVGVYTVTAAFTVDDEAHYEVPVAMTATLTIEDSGRGLQGIAFEDAIVTYDGDAHSIYIKGTLADGISVTYTNNGQTEPGVYSVTAAFSDGAGKFAEMTATLTILRPSLELKDDNGNITLVVDSEDGIDPAWDIVLEETDDVTRTLFAWEADEASETFTLKFMKDGAEVPLEGKVTVRLLIPEEWRDKDFTLRSVGRAAAVEYTREGDYVVFEAEGLSTYAFAVDGIAYLPILLAAMSVSLLGIGTLIVLAIVRKKNRKGE